MTNSARLHALLKDGKIELSVEDALKLALENNLDIVIQSYEPAFAETDLLRTKGGGAARGVAGVFVSGGAFAGAVGAGVGGGGGAGGAYGGGGAFAVGGGAFDPSLNFSYGWNQDTTPLGITVVEGVPVLTTHTASYSYSFGQSFTTGTSYGVNFFGYRQSTSGITSIFDPIVSTYMAVGFQQPLLNGFGRRVGARWIRIAANERRIADSTFRQKAMASVDKVLTLYWGMVSARGHVTVAQKASELAQKTHADISAEQQLGVVASFEVVRAGNEMARQRANMVKARADAEQQQEQLKTVIAKDVDLELAGAEIIPTAELPEPKPDDIPTLAEALRLAAENRPEIEQADLNLRNQEINIKAGRNALLPYLGVFATYAPSGLSGNTVIRNASGAVVSVVPGGLSQSLSQTLRNLYPDYSAGFYLSIPLRNRQAQADLARLVLERRQLEAKLQQQKQAVQEDVRRAVIAATEAKAEIDAARSAVNMAQQTLEGEQKKFQLGESSNTVQIIQAQRDLATAQDEEVTARANYAMALERLAFVTGTVLERNSIEIARGSAQPAREANDTAGTNGSQ